MLPAEVSEWVSVHVSAGQEGARSGEEEEGGLRLEPELDAPIEATPAPEEVELGLDPELDTDETVQAEQARRFRAAARLAALDPDDGIPL